MNLTAREWIELIADPEKKKMAIRLIENYPYEPNSKCVNMKEAVFWGICKVGMSEEDERNYDHLLATPPTLLPIPNKEREAAEALLKEFADFFNKVDPIIAGGDIEDFLNDKY